ncbi:protein kinase domain-containing protein [Frigoriglobus tundricola]|uniref:Protein kinase domain-containing protein n=1 Tax=Frigoriglobus tundricola TaxID=2774151 RepID=A0A6M5YNP3_9BACT|nr:hypothetical protein [Frigoriglobus tundricola]QJW95677.1 hypothetical protein FTUN_3231 [Frigoriglobus tundricola]
MAHSLSLLQDLEQALCETGRAALTGAAPFGAVLGAVARATLELSGADLSAADIRAGLQELANAEQAAYTEMLERTVGAIPDAHADCRGAVRRYLEHWPALIRHVLRRPSNPAGRVVPAGMAFEDPAELLRFLPTGTPRFRPGPVPGVPEWELTRYCGMGDGTEVWGARSTTGAEPAALKFVTDPSAIRRVFDSEPLFTRVFSLTGQSGIVPLRTVYPDPNRVCIEAGYAPGYDLAGVMFDWKWRWGRAMPDPAAGLARRLADVVGKAHARQVVHRNLKPSNVILMPAEGARFALWVTDFGWGQVAAALNARAEVARETPQALRGAHTRLYLAPQVAAGHPADPRDDVYAIGLIWYQLLRQDPAADPARAPDWANELTADGVPEAHVELLAACLAPTAADRPADAGALAQRLSTLPTTPSLQSTARASAPAAAPRPRRPRGSRPKKRRCARSRLRTTRSVRWGARSTARRAAP